MGKPWRTESHLSLVVVTALRPVPTLLLDAMPFVASLLNDRPMVGHGLLAAVFIYKSENTKTLLHLAFTIQNPKISSIIVSTILAYLFIIIAYLFTVLHSFYFDIILTPCA